jgi:uncharacterized membrane protein YiaA
MAESKLVPQKLTGAFIGASWIALLIGVSSYLIGLWNATSMELNEKGYYFTILLFGLLLGLHPRHRPGIPEGAPVRGGDLGRRDPSI